MVEQELQNVVDAFENLEINKQIRMNAGEIYGINDEFMMDLYKSDSPKDLIYLFGERYNGGCSI